MIWLLHSLRVAPQIQFCPLDKAKLPPKGNPPCWAMDREQSRSSTACQGHCPSFAAGATPGLQIPASTAAWRLRSSFQRKNVHLEVVAPVTTARAWLQFISVLMQREGENNQNDYIFSSISAVVQKPEPNRGSPNVSARCLKVQRAGMR